MSRNSDRPRTFDTPHSDRQKRPGAKFVGTALQLATLAFPRASGEETVGPARERLCDGRFELIEIVVVSDANGCYLGVADTRDLLAAAPDTELAAILRQDWPYISPETGQEHVADLAAKTGAAAIPVVGADGICRGCVSARTLMSVLAREHREDMHRIAGILHGSSVAVHALEDPPLRRVSRRLPWLLVGLGLSTLAAMLMSRFEHVLQAQVAVAFFIPSLVYLTDAIGTQTETIAVRALSLRRTPLPRLLANEAATGGMIGLVLGTLAAAGVWGLFGDFRLALGVGLSLLAAGALASVIGLILPWSLSRVNIDPAYGAGPVATILQDVVTILLYFLIVTALASW